MIRHSNSFIISLIFHLSLVFVLFYTYKHIYKDNHVINKKDDNRLCMSLSTLKCEKHTEVKPIKEDVIKKSVKKEMPKKKIVDKKKIKKVVKVKKKKVIEKKYIEPKTEVKKELPKQDEHKQVEHKVVVQKENKRSLTPPKKKIPASKIYIDKNIKIIQELLKDNLYYPRRARKSGIEGDVIIHFRILKTAEVTDIKVLSSKNEILSIGAIKTIEDLSFKFPKPPEDMSISIPINYRLR